MVADIEELEEMDALELHAPKAQCKGSVRCKEVEVSYCQSQMEQSKFLEINVGEHPPQPGSDRNEEKNKKFFKESQMN